MILHIPVRRKTVRINGSDRSVLELANGFVSVTPDDQAGLAIGEVGGRIQISNPLTEVFQDWFARGLIGPHERVNIELEELPFSNPGADDNGTSLHHLDQIV